METKQYVIFDFCLYQIALVMRFLQISILTERLRNEMLKLLVTNIFLFHVFASVDIQQMTASIMHHLIKTRTTFFKCCDAFVCLSISRWKCAKVSSSTGVKLDFDVIGFFALLRLEPFFGVTAFTDPIIDLDFWS